MLLAALVGGACGDKSEPLVPTATVPQGTTTTNPYAIPPVIDEAYVNRVLAGLDQAVGDVTRMILAAEKITNEAADRVMALYIGDALVLKLQGYQRDVLGHFVGYRETLGNKQTTVIELISGRPDCIFAKVNRDVSAISQQPDPGLSTLWVGLVPLDRTTPTASYNTIGWVYTSEGFLQDLSAPPNPCEE